jgi:hypothetical protein
MASKVPPQGNSKKPAGKNLKEKREAKQEKKASRKGYNG